MKNIKWLLLMGLFLIVVNCQVASNTVGSGADTIFATPTVMLLGQGAGGGLAEPQIAEEIQEIFADQDGEISEEDAETLVEVFKDIDVLVRLDTTQDVHPISPLIYGVSGATDEFMLAVKPTLGSWGGNPSTRYNWRVGNAWNTGRDWFYTNVNYRTPNGENASDISAGKTREFGAEMRMAVPTLGWVAKNVSDLENEVYTCSFPLPDGTCGDGDGADCNNQTVIADPTLANVPSDVNDVVEWLDYLLNEREHDIRFIAMDNEPELWGVTHYDVHPDCTTYDEMLDKYIEYASAIRQNFPDVELVGPNTCCWTFYWDSPAGTPDKLLHGNKDFIPWFLGKVREYDEDFGQRTLDVLDIHYYPADIFTNEDNGAETLARRIRSTRSLWDPTYVDESWIQTTIQLIPRMKNIIAKEYPGTKLGISEWNWGGDDRMDGAIAIADVLGIYGREDIYYAAYWTHPEMDTPGFFAFRMYTNFDGEGGRFGDTSVWSESVDRDRVGSYAAIDSVTGNLHVMLLNKTPEDALNVWIALQNFAPKQDAMLYRFEQANMDDIVAEAITLDSNEFGFAQTLPPYSITLLIVEPAE